jgi:malonyl-CoA O-methyltransferase
MKVDVRDVARSFGAASHSYDAAAVLQAEVRNELLSRLEILKVPPRNVLDLGAGTGLGALELRRRLRGARIVAMDIAAPMLQKVRQRSPFWRPIRCVNADASALPFKAGSFDVVFSNLMLQWVVPPDRAFAEIRRVLRPGGVLLATSFGPETLRELRDAWAVVDRTAHVSEFIDVHDLGSALQRAGFAEPVLDVDRIMHFHADVSSLARELKLIGAHNMDQHRARALTGKHRYQQMVQAYEVRRVPKGLPVTWQVVNAVAWAPESFPSPAAAMVDGEAYVGMESLRASLARRRQ